MYGFIYITTNLINNKKYVGRKKYTKGWESYLGSSKLLKTDIEMLGRDCFKREILEECENKDILSEREIFWQRYFNVKNSPDFYNITIANSGFDTSGARFNYSDEQIKKIWTEERRSAQRQRWLDRNNNPNYKESVRKQRSERMKNLENCFFKSDEGKKLTSAYNCKPFVLEYNSNDYYFENRVEAAKVFSKSAVEVVIKNGIKLNNPLKGLKFKKWL